MQAGLRIGAVAKAAGVGVDTIRYYERRGLLPRARRRPSGYREFGPEDVERVRFAKGAQAIGFTLDEVLVFLRAIDRGHHDCKAMRPYVHVAHERVRSELAALRRMQKRLAALLARCERGDCLQGEVEPRVRRRR